MNITLLLDGIDFSSFVPKMGYTVGYREILGGNSCLTLDGKMHDDVLAYKAVINIELNPMDSIQLSKLVSVVEKCKNATYFDTKTNSIVTRGAKVTLTPATMMGQSQQRTFWNQSPSKGMVLTIEER